MRFDFIFSGRFQKIIASLVGIIIIWVFHYLIDRSIWVDEGLLLKNIVESDSWLNYFAPLPYYDQSQPMLISFFHHFVTHNISQEIEILRLSTLTLSLLVSAPILYVLYKEKTGALLPALLFLGFSFSIGFYLTEIKHYAFEIAASFFIIYVAYSYLIDKLSFTYAILLISLFTTIGFSTLIPSFILIIIISTNEMFKDMKNFFIIKNIATLLVAGLLGLTTFFHMQHLTIYQINNHNVYLSQGLLGDIKTLILAGTYIHGIALTIAVATIAIIGLFSDRKSLFFKSTLIYFLIVGFVSIGKLTGLYPIASWRHLIWLAPFSFVLILFGIRYLIFKNQIFCRIIFIGTFLIITTQALNIVYKTSTGEIPEISNNNQLYALLSNLPPSNVVIFPYTQPTLQYYMLLSSDLRKHNFIGFAENISEKKDPSKNFERLFSRIDFIFNQLPKGKFYFLVSHLKPLFSKNIFAMKDLRVDYTESKIKHYNCKHIEIFRGHQVQLLELECGDCIEK